MALRDTFDDVVEMVRNECGLSTNSSRGIDHLQHIKQLVKRHYETLCEDYDWAHLQIKRDSSVSRKVLSAGSRYYDFPTKLNPLYIVKAWVKWGSVWSPLGFGISQSDYTEYDSENNERADPVLKWDFYGGNQFEVWPLPASNGVAEGENEVAFEGLMKPEALVNGNNRLDMDGILVSLMVSAEILSNIDKQRAQVKGDMALARLNRVRGNLGSKKRYVMGGGDQQQARRPRHPSYIA